MKSKQILIGVLLICSVHNGFSQNQRPRLILKGIESKIDQLVKEYQDLDIFSGVVLVSDQGKPVYHKAFGLANREKGIPNTLETKFDIGSMNKTFTRVLILKLFEEGKLKLDDQASDYLNGLGVEASKKVTINQLLNHTSGFGDYLSMEYDQLPRSEKTMEKVLERVKQMPLEFEPGTDQRYSNVGFILLGGIIESVTGKSYYDNVNYYILSPLDLTQTSMKPKSEVENLATGYYRTVDGKIVSNDGFIEFPKPDGGFRATATDILKFYDEFHYGNLILGHETKMKDKFFKMIQPYTSTGDAIPHAGGYPGANTVKYEILRDRVSIIVFANMDEPVAEDLGARILAILRGQNPEKPSFPAVPNVYRAYEKNGLDYVKSHFWELIENFHPTDPKGIILNQVGYFYLRGKKLDKAIEIFELNTELFGDEDPNVWDSLGEAYYTMGERVKALEAYKRALSLDAEFPSAKEMVHKIETEN